MSSDILAKAEKAIPAPRPGLPHSQLKSVVAMIEQAARFSLQQLDKVKLTYRDSVNAVADVQRCILELHGVVNYMDVVKPRLDNAAADFSKRVVRPETSSVLSM